MTSEIKMMRADAYDQLKLRLFAGELRAGQFVSQRELTALLGTTLNPVREAIRRLEVEGLINVYPQRGIQVVEANPKVINDAYEYRLLLETHAVRHFAARAGKAQVLAFRKKVEASLYALEQAPGDQVLRAQVLEEDYQFHKDLIDYQGNLIISKHYSLNAARLRLFRINLGEPLRRLELAATEHLEILDACMNSDAEHAAKLLAAHIGISREHTLGLRPMT
jgi:DNA-binding GntR family transcriptional regulator